MIGQVCSMLFLVGLFVVPLLTLDAWISREGKNLK